MAKSPRTSLWSKGTVLFALTGCQVVGGITDFTPATTSATPTDDDAGIATPSDDAGPDVVDAAAVPTMLNCDPMKAPVDSLCTIDENAIFVAPKPAGSDAYAGTKMEPVLSIGRALELARMTTSKRVYACAALYNEAVVMDAMHDGISMFGGLACPGGPVKAWSYVGFPVVLTAPSSVTPLLIDGTTLPVVIEQFSFVGADSIAPGGSSIAARVSSAAEVTFRHVLFRAGAGLAGSKGVTLASNYTTPEGAAGIAASGATGGPAQTCTCGDGTMSLSGKGGNSGVAGTNGTPTIAGAPATAGAGGAGGANQTPCGAGSPGAAALPAAVSMGATVAGALKDKGWTATAGAKGTNGGPGQGGGGGGGHSFPSPAPSNGGGGGGCGGCGGSAGTAGRSGGSSFALLSFRSKVTLSSCALTAGDAAAGGAPGPGEPAQLPGKVSPGLCNGAAGGAGAAGAAGGGGAGGLSVAIGYVGVLPTSSDVTLVVGAAGAASGNGAPGAAQSTMKLLED